jgi:hypothetical protein
MDVVSDILIESISKCKKSIVSFMENKLIGIRPQSKTNNKKDIPFST